MLVDWKVRYLDRTTKNLNDRHLYLDTATLDAATRAAVETLVETRTNKTEREILRFRSLFVECSPETIVQKVECVRRGTGVFLSNYFEDESGKEITLDEIGQIRSGNPNARLIPSGVRQHDVDFMFAAPKPIPFAEITLNAKDIKVLGYFARDFRELADSAFVSDGPGQITSTGGTFSADGFDPVLTTAVSDDEIRSFVTIFRRLYMTGEEAHFLRAVEVYVNALGDHPYANWVGGTAREYESALTSPIDFRWVVPAEQCTFSRKRLIDVFIYTQYAHQPSDKRTRQFCECLATVHGKKDLFTWMFLTEIWKCSLEIICAGRVISSFFNRYCQHYQVDADVLASLRDDSPGIGSLEKDADRRTRIRRDKAEALAAHLWKQNGSPAGGPKQFLHNAEGQLSELLDKDEPLFGGSAGN